MAESLNHVGQDAAQTDRTPSKAVEWLFCALVLISFGWVLFHLLTYRYLPIPYFYDLNDTFMDWFNPAYWAHRHGQYSIWKTVYPPLSFIILRLLSQRICYDQDAYFARSCDHLGQFCIVIFYLIDAVVIFVALRKRLGSSGTPRALSLIFGLPLLYILERGNLLLIATLTFVIATGDITPSTRLKALMLGLSINIKPYLVIAIIPDLIKRRWQYVEQAGILTVSIYLFSFLINGEGGLVTLIQDIAFFSNSVPNAFIFAESYYSTSLSPYIQLSRSSIPLYKILGSYYVDLFDKITPVIIYIGVISGILALLAAGFAKRLESPLALALIIGAFLIYTDPGGYVQIFLIISLFSIRRPTLPEYLAIILGYVLCISYDYQIYTLYSDMRSVFLTNALVSYKFGIDAGSFIRPVLIIGIEVLLSLGVLARIAPMIEALPNGGRWNAIYPDRMG